MDGLKELFGRIVKFFDMVTIYNFIAKPHPDLKLHRRHGKSIEVDEINSVATRSIDDYQNGIIFSDRCVKLEEPVCVKILKRNSAWAGPLWFGFTTVNPSLLRPEELEHANLLKCRYPRGFFFRGLTSSRCNFLVFSMTRNGDVMFRTDEDDGYTIANTVVGLERDQRIWAVVDVFGSYSSVQFVYHPVLIKRVHQDLRRESLGSVTTASEGSDEDMSSDMEWDTDSEDGNVMDALFNAAGDLNRTRSNFYAIASPWNPEAEGTSSTTSKSPSQNICVICQEAAANHAFLNCGHMCVCQNCAGNFRSRRESVVDDITTNCPMCRKRHSGLLRIY